MTIKSAWSLGAGRVIAVDHVPERLRKAETEGKAETINFLKEDVYDRLIEMTKTAGPIPVSTQWARKRTGAEASAPFATWSNQASISDRPPACPAPDHHVLPQGGHLSIPGVYLGFLDKVPFGAAFGKGLTFKMGQTHAQKYLGPLLERIEKREIDPSFVITHRLPLREAPAAYKTFRDKEDGCIKVLLTPPACPGLN
jgi:threonine dehydrogenase-like Zn-dependent dehydrogenase